MMSALAIEPYCPINAEIYSFAFPTPVAEKAGIGGFSMSIHSFFEHFAKVNEDKDPKYAALLRESASYFPHVYGAHVISRDKNGNMVFDLDDWDDLSDDAKINRGNRYAAIANLDGLRYRLELASDGSRDADWVTLVRRRLAELAELIDNAEFADIAEDIEALAAKM